MKIKNNTYSKIVEKHGIIEDVFFSCEVGLTLDSFGDDKSISYIFYDFESKYDIIEEELERNFDEDLFINEKYINEFDNKKILKKALIEFEESGVLSLRFSDSPVCEEFWYNKKTNEFACCINYNEEHFINGKKKSIECDSDCIFQLDKNEIIVIEEIIDYFKKICLN